MTWIEEAGFATSLSTEIVGNYIPSRAKFCIWETDTNACRLFTHGKISLMNQGSFRAEAALRTLLSTESV
jgi:hypothetical protein